MKNTLTESGFRDEFHKYGRGEQFSYEGLGALFNYLEQLEEDCDMEIEMDVISLCCDFSEYEDLKEIQANYTEIEDMEDLYNHTQVIEYSSGIIIQNY